MAKKTRKQKQRAARRVTPQPSERAQPVAGASVAPAASGVDLAEAPEPTDVAPVETDVAAPRRRIERVTPGAAAQRPAGRQGRVPATAAAMLQPLDADDAAIPFDRVPYVPADLRRVAIMAVLMVALIVVAAIIVSNVVR